MDISAGALGNANGRDRPCALKKPRSDGVVLVCDDNLMNQEVIGLYLKRMGIRSVAAHDGKACVEMVQERINNGEPPFDLIFMDMLMPIMDGSEATERISALCTGVPIVAMTANAKESDLAGYRKLGISECLGKPFTTQELLGILQKYFE